MFSVRLACVKRAASVRPEPGSNSLFKLYIQTLRVFISILAITIRSQLPLWFFCLFWLLKVPISWNLKGFFACSALFNFQDTFEAAFVLQLLYYITFRSFCQVNILWTEVQMLSFLFASRRDQLFYFITFCRFCQVNILWTEVHSIFSFPFPRQPVQNSYPIHSTTLQTFCQVNFSWTTSTAPLSISRSVSRFLLSTSFLDSRSRATALLLYHAFLHLSSKIDVKYSCWILSILPYSS